MEYVFRGQDHYDKAISLKPDYAQAYRNRGNALLDLTRLGDAVASYEQALAIDPDLEFLFGMYLHTRMKLCDWHALPDALRRLEADIASAKPVTAPFPVLALIDSPQLQKQAAEIYAQAKHPRNHALGPISMRSTGGKIRVGYYSADFHNHATAYLMAELFEAHDADKFELYGFSFGPDKQDEMRARVSGAFDKFYDVRGKSDREIAQLSRDMGIDIAVDLKGYTQGARRCPRTC